MSSPNSKSLMKKDEMINPIVKIILNKIKDIYNGKLDLK